MKYLCINIITAKNLILSGAGRIILHDPEKVDLQDLSSQVIN